MPTLRTTYFVTPCCYMQLVVLRPRGFASFFDMVKPAVSDLPERNRRPANERA